MSYDVARALIEDAMGDLAVVVCWQCRGLGKIPEALHVLCPRCNGRGETIERGEKHEC